MNVLCCGSRSWTDGRLISERIAALPDDAVVIEGCAPGADMLAGSYALDRGLFVAEMAVRRVHWDRHGRGAGHKRNAAMLGLAPDLVIAFTLGTPGTQGTIDGARRRGIEVEVVEA